MFSGSFDEIDEVIEGLAGVDLCEIDEGMVVCGDEAACAHAPSPSALEGEGALE